MATFNPQTSWSTWRDRCDRPDGIAGPRELDVANAALYNDWGEESSARITRLARLTRTDPAFALRFGQLSAMYSTLVHRY